MAENIGNIGNELGQGDQKFREEVYEQLWTIPDWEKVQQSEDTLAAQSCEFETGKSTRVQAKWKVGLNIGDGPPPPRFRFYWKLLAEKGFQEGKVHVKASIMSANPGNFPVVWSQLDEKAMTVEQVLLVPRNVAYHMNSLQKHHNLLNSNGELALNLKVTVMEPQPLSVDSEMKLFHGESVNQLCVNFGALLEDKATADLKIMTSDGKELLAHRIILKAQCTVFESMFRSDLSENKSGTVNVKDIGSKTMGILLHYFYTGELFPSWKDEDTVVEFTYAVGKYQLTNVLNFLDSVLGRRDEEDATYTDVKLLSLVQKLGLKTAEVELVERIKRTTSNVGSGYELLALYGIGQ